MLTKKAIVLHNLPFTIEAESVLKEMRISRIKSLEELEEKSLAQSIKNAMDKAYSLIHGQGVYQTYPLSGVKDDLVSCDGAGDIFKGKNMVKLLGQCDFATLMAATIGPELENEVEKIQRSDELTDAYALEMVGGLMADYMVESVDGHVEQQIRKQGYDRTMRYSPGYGDWSLKNQPEIIRLSGAEKIGITLTDSNIMIPRKSVTAVIGWKRLS